MRIGLLVRNLEEPGGIGAYTRELLDWLLRLDRTLAAFREASG